MGASTKIIDIEALKETPREELIATWRKAFGSEPPKGLRQPFLAHLLAYDLQTQAYGSLSTRIEKRLLAIAAGETPKPQAPRLKPGAQLTRTWNDTPHRVDVSEGGFLYRGKTYRSLSAIANEITGAHWSGPRFFGLKAQP